MHPFRSASRTSRVRGGFGITSQTIMPGRRVARSIGTSASTSGNRPIEVALITRSVPSGTRYSPSQGDELGGDSGPVADQAGQARPALRGPVDDRQVSGPGQGELDSDGTGGTAGTEDDRANAGDGPGRGNRLEPLPSHQAGQDSHYPLKLAFGRTLTHFHAFYDEGRASPSLAKHNTEPKLWISRADADARQLSDGDAIKIHNERGEFGAKAHVTDDVGAGTVWMRDGWVGLNHLTSGEAVVGGDALTLFPFSVGQSSYAARVEISRE